MVNKNSILITGILFLMFLPSLVYSADNYDVSKDAWGDNNNQDFNFGIDTVILFNSVSRVYLWFDWMDNYPLHSTVSSASISIYFQNSCVAGDVKGFHPITESWNEGTCTDVANNATCNGATFNERNFGTNWGGSAFNTGYKSEDNCTAGTGWKSFDVTSSANAMINGDVTNEGWMLKVTSGSSNHEIRSEEYSGGGYGANLAVTVSIPEPNVQVTAPTNNQWLGSKNITITCDADFTGIATNGRITDLYYYIVNSSSGIGDLLYSFTESVSPVINKVKSHTFVTTLEDGQYWVQCGADTSFSDASQTGGTYLDSANVPFNLDVTAPTVNITYPTDNLALDYVQVNISYIASDTNLNNCSWSDNGGSTTSINCSLNLTGQSWSEGEHNITIYAEDNQGNTGSDTVTFKADTTSPIITITTPSTQGTWNQNNDVNVSATITDATTDSCWFTQDNGATNTSFNCDNGLDNTTWTDGLKNVTVYVNDSIGRIASDSIGFYVDTIDPILIIISPTAGTGTGLTFTFTYNITDTNIDSCWYNLNSTSGWYFANNQSISCGTNKSKQVTVSGASWDLFIWGNDSSSRIGVDSVENIIASIPPASGGGGGGGGGIPHLPSIILPATNFSIETTSRGTLMDFVIAKGSVKDRRKLFYLINRGLEDITVTLVCDTTTVNSTNIENEFIDICDYVSFEESTIIVSPNENVPTPAYIIIKDPPNSSFGDTYDFNIIALEKLDDTTSNYAKLSVASRVPVWGLALKWSYVPFQGDIEPELRNQYPATPISIFLSFFVFSGIFLLLRKKLPTAGFLIAMVLFFISYVVLLFFI